MDPIVSRSSAPQNDKRNNIFPLTSNTTTTRAIPINPARLVLLLALSLGLSACGVQFLYNNLDSIARVELGTYIDLTQEQEVYFEQEFAKLWQWHRETELPNYAEALEGWALLTRDGVTGDEIDLALGTMQGWWLRVEAKGMPAAVELLRSLEDSKVTHIAEVLEKENAKQEKRIEKRTPEERQRRWRKNFQSLLENFTGRLGSQQQQVLITADGRYRAVPELWHEYSLRWQREFLSLLEERRNKETFEPGLERIFGPQEPYYSEALIEAQAHNEALSKELLVALLASMNEAQLERFSETLSDRARDFRELAAEAR